MDNDRTARLETDVEEMDEKLDEILARLSQTESGTHTHTQSPSTTTSTSTSTDVGEHGTDALTDAEVRSMSQGEKAKRTIDYIHDAYLGTTLPGAKLRDYCDEIAGVGDRSFDSYRTVFKNKASCSRTHVRIRIIGTSIARSSSPPLAIRSQNLSRS